MANTLANFLVGIGLDYDNKGAKQAVSSLDSIKRTALQAGAAVAGAFGAKALTKGLADQTRGYSLLAEQIGSTANELFALDRVYQRAGGGAGAIIGQLERLKELSASQLTGDLGWVEGAAKAGIDVSAILNVDDPAKIFDSIIAQLEGMSTNQRINAINALGLDPTTINIAEDGLKNFRMRMQEAMDMRSISSQLEKDSEEFATQWFDLWDNIGSVTDRAGAKIIPKVNEITGSINSFFRSNREGINSGVDMVFGKIADNLELVAIAAASLAAAGIGSTLGSMARNLPIIGSTASALGAVAKNLGLIGVAAAGASVGAGLIDEQLQKSSLYQQADAKFTEWVFNITGLDLSRGKVHTDNRAEVDLDAMARDMMTRLPEFEPTVITPDRVAPLSQPVQQAEAVTAQAQSQQSSIGYNYTQSRPIVNNIYLEGRMIKQVVNQAIDENAEQAVRDLRSPIDR